MTIRTLLPTGPQNRLSERRPAGPILTINGLGSLTVNVTRTHACQVSIRPRSPGKREEHGTEVPCCVYLSGRPAGDRTSREPARTRSEGRLRPRPPRYEHGSPPFGPRRKSARPWNSKQRGRR